LAKDREDLGSGHFSSSFGKIFLLLYNVLFGLYKGTISKIKKIDSKLAFLASSRSSLVYIVYTQRIIAFCWKKKETRERS